MAMPALPRLRHDVYPVTRDVDFKAITLQVQDVDRIYGELTPVQLCSYYPFKVRDSPAYHDWICITQGPFHLFAPPLPMLRALVCRRFKELRGITIIPNFSAKVLTTGHHHVALRDLCQVLSSAGVQHVRYVEFGLKADLWTALLHNGRNRDLYEATRSDDNSFDISVSIPHKDIVLLTLPPGIGSVMPLLGHSNLGWIQFELPEVPKLLSSLRKVEEVLETAQVDAVLHLTQYGLGPSDDPSAWMGIVWKACERKGGTPRGSSLRVVQSRFNDICNILGLYYSTRAPDFADNWWSNPELTTTAEVQQRLLASDIIFAPNAAKAFRSVRGALDRLYESPWLLDNINTLFALVQRLPVHSQQRLPMLKRIWTEVPATCRARLLPILTNRGDTDATDELGCIITSAIQLHFLPLGEAGQQYVDKAPSKTRSQSPLLTRRAAEQDNLPVLR
ncbi:hypothetical protein RI367_006084 [Sorochytrium milnesiophthora]